MSGWFFNKLSIRQLFPDFQPYITPIRCWRIADGVKKWISRLTLLNLSDLAFKLRDYAEQMMMAISNSSTASHCSQFSMQCGTMLWKAETPPGCVRRAQTADSSRWMAQYCRWPNDCTIPKSALRISSILLSVLVTLVTVTNRWLNNINVNLHGVVMTYS